MLFDLMPKEWTVSKLGTVCSKPQYGYTTKASIEGEVKFLRTTDITKGSLSWDSVPFCLEEPDDVSKYQLEDNDIVISRAGSIGFSALLKTPPERAVFASYLIRFKPCEFINPRYLKRFLESNFYWSQLSEKAAGNAVQNVNANKLSDLDLLIAPLAEQREIADRLDTLLAQVDTLKGRLDALPAILKRFRQSVLAAAVSGKLTEEWRGQPDLIGWDRKTILDVVKAKPRNGSSPKGVDYETPYRNLTLSATTPGYFVEGKFKFVDVDIPQDSYLWVKPGDILIQRANTLEYVGVSAIYKGSEYSYVYPDLMMKCTPNDSVLGDYLHYSLLSQSVRKYFRDNATGTAGNMPKINQKIVCAAPINLPPIAEQTEIVRRVEQLFAFADQIEQRVKAAQSRVNHLTQSILAKAFRGELTADWREQHPELISGEHSAEALLDRIEAERAAQTPAKRTRRKKASA